MTETEGTYTVDVGWTTDRPVVADQYVSRVVVEADGPTDAHLTAAYWIMNRPKAWPWKACEMVTSTRIVRLEC